MWTVEAFLMWFKRGTTAVPGTGLGAMHASSSKESGCIWSMSKVL